MPDAGELAEENKRLKRRLQQYRRAAAVMLVDWNIVPAEGFKAKLARRHMALLRGLIRADLADLGAVVNPQRRGRGGRPRKKLN